MLHECANSETVGSRFRFLVAHLTLTGICYFFATLRQIQTHFSSILLVFDGAAVVCQEHL